MNKKFMFSASLRVTHPSISAEDILSYFKLEPKIVQSVGMRRSTTSGTQLPGTYEKTYVSFLMDIRGFNYPEDFLFSQLKQEYLHDTTHLKSLTQSGGRIEFFFGLECKENDGMVFDHNLISSLAEKSISLSFDIYSAHNC